MQNVKPYYLEDDYQAAVTLHNFVYRPPRPIFRYEPWMAELGRLDKRRRRPRHAHTPNPVDGNALREAYEAGLRGDLDAVESFVGLCDLANEKD